MALAVAWFLRQTQGAAIVEIYALLTRPFQGESPLVSQQQLSNAHTQELEQRLAELEKQNQQLKALLGYVQKQQQPGITAPVIGHSADEWWKQVILGRGRQDGIEVGFVVMGIGGLVGQVTAVTPHTSRVLLISDSTSRVGATVSRSRSMGIVQGKGDRIATMQFFDKVPNVRPGDTIATSSVSRLFPPGLPLGRVQSMKQGSGPAPEATIQLTAPINYLEWVVVYPFKNP